MNIEQNIRKLTSTVKKHNLNSGGWLGITGSAIISGAQTSPTGVFAVSGCTPLFMLRLFTAYKHSNGLERHSGPGDLGPGRDVFAHLCVVPQNVQVSDEEGLVCFSKMRTLCSVFVC